VVTGAGKHFSAGADIGEFATLRAGVAGARRHAGIVHAAERALAEFELPTVAAINGFCIGGGCEISLACDIRIGARDAKFGITPANLGLVYHYTSTKQLVDVVGPAWAKQILFSAELIDSDIALRIGLVNEVHDAAEVLPRARALARRIASRAPISVRGAKTIVNDVLVGVPGDDARFTELYERAPLSAEYAEGVAAFVEKRTPRF
jgi:enoyl-CoA hydratase/carnithine racemase